MTLNTVKSDVPRVSFRVTPERFGAECDQCVECGGFVRQNGRCVGCALLDSSTWPLIPGDACWGWCGAKRGHYGIMRVTDEDGRRLIRSVHRVAYGVWISPLLPFCDVKHECDNLSCINPYHLRLGRQIEHLAVTGGHGLARAMNVRPGGSRVWG